ncbi:MAG: hypothetical protein ACXVDD_17040 [Polyangia bacterium]
MHAHLLGAAAQVLKVDRSQNGLVKAHVAAAVVYKAAHPNGWTRYI